MRKICQKFTRCSLLKWLRLMHFWRELFKANRWENIFETFFPESVELLSILIFERCHGSVISGKIPTLGIFRVVFWGPWKISKIAVFQGLQYDAGNKFHSLWWSRCETFVFFFKFSYFCMKNGKFLINYQNAWLELEIHLERRKACIEKIDVPCIDFYCTWCNSMKQRCCQM